jgi:hypothetical protein
MLRFKQFLIEQEVKLIPGQGNVFIPQQPENPHGSVTNVPGKGNVYTPPPSTPQTTNTAPQQSQTTPSENTNSPKPRETKVAGYNDLDDFQNFVKQYGETVWNEDGTVRGIIMKGQHGFDEYGRPTLKSLSGRDHDLQIWKKGEGYTTTGIGKHLETLAKMMGINKSGSELWNEFANKGMISLTNNNSNFGKKMAGVGAAGLAAAGSVAGSALTQGVQAATDVMGAVGSPPTGKDRMQIEKSFNSDLGLGFDLSPEGELVGNPQGREAARKRQQSGINFPSMFR